MPKAALVLSRPVLSLYLKTLLFVYTYISSFQMFYCIYRGFQHAYDVNDLTVAVLLYMKIESMQEIQHTIRSTPQKRRCIYDKVKHRKLTRTQCRTGRKNGNGSTALERSYCENIGCHIRGISKACR